MKRAIITVMAVALTIAISGAALGVKHSREEYKPQVLARNVDTARSDEVGSKLDSCKAQVVKVATLQGATDDRKYLEFLMGECIRFYKLAI